MNVTNMNTSNIFPPPQKVNTENNSPNQVSEKMIVDLINSYKKSIIEYKKEIIDCDETINQQAKIINDLHELAESQNNTIQLFSERFKKIEKEQNKGYSEKVVTVVAAAFFFLRNLFLLVVELMMKLISRSAISIDQNLLHKA